MPKAVARRAVASPIAPGPTMPSVFPRRPVPSSAVKFHCHGSPVRTRRSAAPRPRVVISTRAIAMSAVASVSTPGVFVTTTPRSLQAATSTLSYPTTTSATTCRPGPAASRSSASTRSTIIATRPSTPATAWSSSSRGMAAATSR